MSEELYKKHRPESLKDVVGQQAAISTLVDLGKRGAIPHCILFTGPSGVGKTTIARILRKKLKCGDADYREMNASAKDTRGIAAVAQIQSSVNLAPISGKTRVWVIDEAHQLTTDAQNSFLKTLEDTPKHCYFMLSTTDPQKLKRTIVTRSHEVKLGRLSLGDLKKLVEDVVEKEDGKELSEEEMDKLVQVADGSARKALVILHAVIGEEDEEKRLEKIMEGDYRAAAIEIARLLLREGVSWKEVAKVLRGLEKEDPEAMRRMMIGYCRVVLLGGGPTMKRASILLDRFQDNLFDSGLPGFALACYDVIQGD